LDWTEGNVSKETYSEASNAGTRGRKIAETRPGLAKTVISVFYDQKSEINRAYKEPEAVEVQVEQKTPRRRSAEEATRDGEEEG
jgi:hypothetical protein